MLRRPRPLPQRFNRKASPQMRRLVEKRHERRRKYRFERFRRMFHRWGRQANAAKGVLLRFIFFIVGALVILTIGVVLFSPLLNVREVRVARSDPRIDIERVQRLLKPLFGKHLLFLSSQEVFPLLKEGLLATKENSAEPGLPELTDVTVQKRYPSTLILQLKLDPLIARVTLDDPSVQAGSGAKVETVDFLTAQGVYVSYLPQQVDNATALPLIKVTDWSVRPAPFTPMIEQSLLKTMQNTENALQEQFGHKIRERTVYLRAQEFHLTAPEYALWFDLKSPIEDQLHRYRLFLKNVGKGAAKKYVDLRLTERVVYR